MMDGNLNRLLIAKADTIGQRRINNIQTELAEILQDAAPDAAVNINDNALRITARRLFERMMRNDKLRSPQSFLEKL